MDCQDWKIVTLNSKEVKMKKQNNKEMEKKISQKKVEQDFEETKVEVDKKLGKIISQARLTKGINSQKEMATLLNISPQIYAKWENNSLIPSNLELSKLEKILKIPKTFPRSKIINK